MAKSPDQDSNDDDDVTPTKRKPSTNNNNAPRTPRKASASKPNAHPSTPARKISTTPASAPTRTKPGARKEKERPEPTLLGDFLLGRPSPARQRSRPSPRRKSLDNVKAEMNLRAEVVGRVQPPGKVQERVKMWQKEVVIPRKTVEEEIEEEEEEEEERIGRNKRPGRRKDGEVERAGRSKSAGAPKKRVISDDHWMKNKDKNGNRNGRKSPPRGGKGVPIPKDFLNKTAQNPPLEKKIQDWVKRNASEEPEKKTNPRSRRLDTDEPERPKSKWLEPEENEKPRCRKVSRQEVTDDGIRIKPSKDRPSADGIRVRPSRSPSIDDGIRITPSKDRTNDDGIRVRPSLSPSIDDGIRITPSKDSDDGIRIKPSRESSEDERTRAKPLRKGTSKRRPNETELQNPRKQSQHLKPPPESRHASYASHDGANEQDEEDDRFSWMTPSPPENSKRRNRNSETPPESVAEIPFGNSAFSVLDLPVGAEAGTMRRPAPKRNNSFAAVPKVLKRVYNEGKKIVQDTVEPPRAGPNQPPSIESWLNGTTDPFIDRPTSEQTLEVPESHPSRMKSYKEDDRTERELTGDGSTPRRKRRPRTSLEKDEEGDGSPVGSANNRETLPSMENSPPLSSTGLKRTPAKRNTTSPKSARKLPLKEAIFEAFKGESAIRPKSTGSSPSPFAEITGLRERAAELRPLRDVHFELDDVNGAKTSPRSHARDTIDDQERPLPAFPRRPPPTTGEHRLSTIASVETFSSLSSATETTADTASQLSHTTVTQSTVLTRETTSSVSQNSSKPGLKRRLTKHSDLLSVLSLPDTTQPGRAKSIRSARSVRTARSRLETATVQDLMRELAEDETKYMRELKTLVDGVIPVLLTCVLSKSDSAVAAGLFNPLANASPTSFTKPIVDMGVALERLKSLHKRIPLTEPDTFLHWAESACKTYEDYLNAWRTGFEDVVVNLAPALPSASDLTTNQDEMPRNKNGDVVNDNGERVDVAHLMKRPHVRVKHLARAIEGMDRIKSSEASRRVLGLFQATESTARRRIKEEKARQEDLRASNTDATRARDPKNLGLAEGVTINRSLQVYAEDSFSFDISHSSGQRIECQVELILRDMPKSDESDVLICEVDDVRRFLLFPPIDRKLISARMGEKEGQLVVMIRGGEGSEWKETFILETDELGAAEEWVKMLGTTPVPPEVNSRDTAPTITITDALDRDDVSVSIPIGERRRGDDEERTAPRTRKPSATDRILDAKRKISSKKEVRYLSMTEAEEKGYIAAGHIRSELCIVDKNEANVILKKTGLPLFYAKPIRPQRYHGTEAYGSAEMSGGLDPYPEDKSRPSSSSKESQRRSISQFGLDGADDPPSPPKVEKESTPISTEMRSTPLTESMRPDGLLKKQRPTTPTRDDGAPPPPAHKTPVTPDTLKKTPVLETPTPRGKNRRTSSPLKHEWQPSDASGTSSSEEDSDSYSDTYSDSSDDELEAVEIPTAPPAAPTITKKLSPSPSMYSLPNTTLAPSNSASQAPYRSVPPVERTDKNTKKAFAMLMSWSDKKGRWEELYKEPCSIVVTPGLIEAFELTAANRENLESSNSSYVNDGDAGAQRPLIGQVLTPVVSLRQSSALDIEIGSPPTEQSRLKSSSKILYRSINDREAQALYLAIHYARLENPIYKKLEQERIINSYGNHAYEAAVAGNRRRSWFGRKKSYRASTRAPSEMESEQSGRSSSSAFSALRRMSGAGMFNIAKSSVDTAQGRNPSSTGSSEYSSSTPPRTPTSPSLAGGSSAYSTGVAVRDLGHENLKIRLYALETATRWNDLGAARLTVTSPPPGMRQASALNHGVEKRIIVTRKPLNNEMSSSDGQGQVVLLDVVLGAQCFGKIGRTGICVNVWEDVMGESGVMPAVGGVAGRTRKWLFQTGRAGDCEWIFGLVGVGR